MKFFKIRPNLTTLILSTLIVSGSLRTATTGLAYAADADVKMPANPAMSDEGMPMNSQKCSDIENPDAFIAALRDREMNLQEQELQLQMRRQDLAISEQIVRDQIAKLEAAEERLSATLSLADDAAESDIGQITSVYEKMKPKSAAQIFEGMDPRFAAGFLMAMNPESAAAIMTNLSSEKAYSVSVLMAARNARTPKE